MPAWSGLYNHIHGVQYTLLGAKTNIQRRISRVFEKRGARVTGELALTLDGVAPGATAQVTYPRIANPDSNPLDEYPYHGKRTIETVTMINRATTSADQAAIAAMIDDKFAPTSYPSSKDGRKPGGMVGGF